MRNLRAALDALQGPVRTTRVSSWFETDPVGVRDQPPFLNLAVQAETTLEPGDLLSEVKRIEYEVGRRPTFRWGPRVVDIDILLYGDLVLETPDLVIPHPRMEQRAFVLVPLAQLASSRIYPGRTITIGELASQVDGRAGVMPYDENRSSPRQSSLE